MTRADFSHLSRDGRLAVERYLTALADELEARGVGLDAMDEVEAYLLDSLAHGDDADAVTRALAELGAPGTYAGAVTGDVAGERSERGSGTVLGIPWDVRVPTPERVASRYWNPRDPRLFMPRVFGIGWDLNFGALAVRLHLIEPDAEDEPFEHTPEGAFVVALLVPIACVLAIMVSYSLLLPVLPATLPAHFDAAGHADEWWPRARAFAFLLALSAPFTVWAVWSVVASRARLSRGAVIGLATLLSTIAAGVWAVTLLSALAGFEAWWLVLAVLGAAIASALAVLVALARAGRAAEMRRDLGPHS